MKLNLSNHSNHSNHEKISDISDNNSDVLVWLHKSVVF